MIPRTGKCNAAALAGAGTKNYQISVLNKQDLRFLRALGGGIEPLNLFCVFGDGDDGLRDIQNAITLREPHTRPPVPSTAFRSFSHMTLAMPVPDHLYPLRHKHTIITPNAIRVKVTLQNSLPLLGCSVHTQHHGC